MEIAKRKRRVIRAQATRIINEADDILAKQAPAPDIAAVSGLIERLLLVQRQLSDVNAAIEPHIIDDDADAEFEQVMEYHDKIASRLGSMKSFGKSLTDGAQIRNLAPATTTAQVQIQSQRTRLPKLELKKFDGKRKNWQPFWEQFEAAIHKNHELSDIDRFNYLKSLLSGEAEGAIAGLQATAECYADAIEILAQRFGNPTALIPHHMQGLIDLKPVTSARNVRELRRLFDDLQVHMRGLKALGVGEDSYKTMLYPLLLRALPQEMVLNYHRSQAEAQPDLCTSSTDGSSSAGSATEHLTALTTLLRYFRRELESQERALEHRPDNSIGKPAFHYDREKVKPQRSNCRPSSAAALHGSAVNVECQICGSTDHESRECSSNLDLSEKKAILSAKGICFRCTKKGHIARECRVRIACKRCNRRHATSMCNPAFASAQREKDTETRPKEQVSLHASGADAGGTKETILMPTVTAWNKGTKTKKLSRILFDSGSQRTFITEECSRKLGCKLLGTEILTVGLFRGQQKPDSFRRVEVRLLTKDNCKEEYVFDALEVPTICEQIIPCPDEQVKETLRELSLPLSDDSIEQDATIDVLIAPTNFGNARLEELER
ncbi:hypothetical protein HPB50_024380 [Hyalomma asiaticum]|uniref:Uncharacterized protein n=1 Tax=Hyalomma asiaticum TaxID=266040 RepID=A0ACB7S889_HYAAI|nr:hypothetical protein HPB50_024380 [Hyalomma asiaticum]